MPESPRAKPTRDDFQPYDWDSITEAIAPVTSAIEDIDHHRIADGSWQPYAERGDVLELIGEAHAILDQLERPIKEARAELARIERAARREAYRRTAGS